MCGVKLRIVDDEGELLITLGQLYTLLKRGIKFEGPYAEVEGEVEEEEVPEVEFCPSEEDIAEVPKTASELNLCTEVYKYYGDKCAACAIKVYSIVMSEWVLDLNMLRKIFEISKKYDLKLEWRCGSIVLTHCSDSWKKSLDVIANALKELM